MSTQEVTVSRSSPSRSATSAELPRAATTRTSGLSSANCSTSSWESSSSRHTAIRTTPRHLHAGRRRPARHQGSDRSAKSGRHRRNCVDRLSGVAEAACYLHKGTMDRIGEGYQALATWIEDHGYARTAPPERYTSSVIPSHKNAGARNSRCRSRRADPTPFPQNLTPDVTDIGVSRQYRSSGVSFAGCRDHGVTTSS